MAKISIIANFYKSERYIPKLIESVIAQTYEDWELLCVNDCSPGRDKEIILKYAAKDKRIRLVDNEVNLGICMAKYRGIQEAHGKYLCFIDGDDWLEPEALQRMVRPALKYDLDMVVMNHRKVLPILGYGKVYHSEVDYDIVIETNPSANRFSNARQNFEKYYGNWFGRGKFMVTYWGKLIKKSVIESSGFTPPSEYVGEDFVFTMAIFPFAKRIMFIDYVGYNWRWGGLTSGKKNHVWTGEKNIRRSNEIYEERLKLIDRYGLQCYELPLMLEQRNNFEGYIGNEARYAMDSEQGQQIIKTIKEVISAEFYSTFVKLKESDNKYSDDVLLDCLIKRDAVGVYDYCRKVYKANSKRRLLKSIVHAILYPLAKV